MTIYVFGNILMDNDKLTFHLLPMLKQIFPKITFIYNDPNEDFFPKEDPIVILDTVIGIKSVTLFDDIEDFLFTPRVSLHDYDLGFHLKLLKKLRKLNDICIIGVPSGLSKNTALKQVERIIKSIRKSN